MLCNLSYHSCYRKSITIIYLTMLNKRQLWTIITANTVTAFQSSIEYHPCFQLLHIKLEPASFFIPFWLQPSFLELLPLFCQADLTIPSKVLGETALYQDFFLGGGGWGDGYHHHSGKAQCQRREGGAFAILPQPLPSWGRRGEAEWQKHPLPSLVMLSQWSRRGRKGAVWLRGKETDRAGKEGWHGRLGRGHHSQHQVQGELLSFY